MATYFKYAERSAEDYVDWGAIGKTMSDTLLKEEENRRKIKADIDKASNEFGEVLSNSPQGEHRGMNEYAQEFASNAQQFQLMQLRNLKAGKLSLKDYLVSRENIKQGANDAFDIIKKYNDKYGEYQQSVKDGVASEYQTFLLGEVEGFGNLTKASLYINPTNGKVSAAFRQTKDPSKPYDPVDNPYTSKMETDPSKFRSLVDLNFALSAKIDKYDAQGAIDGIADSYAKTYEVITEKGPRGAFVITDNITQYGELTNAEIKANFKKAQEDGYEGTLEEYSEQEKSKSDFAQTLNQAIIADFKTNPIQTISTLVDYIGEIPVDEDGNFDENGTLTKVGFTRNYWEANAHTILLKPNPEQPEGGTDVMDTEADGAQELLDYMTNQIGKKVISQLNQKIKIGMGRAPQQATQTTLNRRAEEQRARSVGGMLSLLRVGNAAQAKQAEEYFVNTTANFGDKAVRGMTRTNTGVTVTYANGDTQTFNFAEGGKFKTNDEWLRSASSGIASTDDFRNVVSGGSKYRNKGINEDAGTVEHFIKRAQTPKDIARKGLDDLLSQMLEGGGGSDKNLAREVGLQLKASGGKYSILQDGVELQSDIPANTTAVMQALKGVILNDEMLIENAIPALQKQGVEIGGGEGNSMAEY